MSRKVLVTGGAGFIGSHVAEAYIAAGDRVWIVDDLSSGRTENVPTGAELVVSDIGNAGLDRLFESVGGFDVVNHHAAQIDVRVSVAEPRRDAAVNVDGFLNVLGCAVRHRAGRFLFVSSGGVVYGEPDLRPTPETASKLPLSPYGVTKLSAEYYLYYYHRVHGLEYVALRYSNVYGPRQDPHGEAGVVAIFASRVLGGAELTIFGDGEQTRDYVFVADVVAANMLLTDAALPPGGSIDDRAFNIGTSEETSVKQLAELMMEAAGSRVPVRHAAERKGELRNSCLDTRRIRTLGWSPSVTLAQGLEATYHHIAAQQEVAS
jgi:UDP-glucose 4-epimerase